MTSTTEPPSHAEAPPSAGDVVAGLRRDRLRAALFDEPSRERRLGRYRVIGTLGRGGMGTVLEAIDDTLERRVALKVLHRDVSPRDQGRLLREARALANLSHPNVVQVHEVGEQPRPFIAMERLHGQTLAQWQRQRPPWRACVRAYVQAGRGLAAAHAQGLVHRDFKPSNCIIDDDGRVRVMDFGLARSVGSEAEPSEPGEPQPMLGDSTRDDTTSLTATGAVLGTLAYMPLEQLEGQDVDARSDQFGFCVSLYEALYGHRPFAGRTLAARQHALAHEQVQPPPRDARLPAALRRALLRGLSADPARRWPSMNALLEVLERLVRPRWRGRLALATVVLGVGLAGVSVWRELVTRQACVGVEDQLAEVWDPARREQLREALVGSPLPYAQDAWERVEPRLDAYAAEWVEASREVCEQARIRQEQPESVVALRSACLHDRRVALRETVDVLASAEPAVVERAMGLVVQLPQLDRCHDVPALLAELPPPEDPVILARVQDLRDGLTEARALRIAGRYANSLAVVERVAKEAESLAYAPLLAEIAHARGWARYGEGKQGEAVAAFEDAYARAVAEGHDAVAADAAAMLSYIVGERQSKHELGLQWSVAARAHARRPAAGPGAEALALANVAAVHHQIGDLEQAKSAYEEALQRQEQAFGADDVRLAFTLNGLALVYLSLGDSQGAIALHERALELRRKSLGPHHPHVAMSLNNIGVALHRQLRYDEAERYVRDALEIKERILGPEHPEVVSSITNLATLALLRHDYDEALARFRRSLAVLEKTEGSSDAQLASILHNIGYLHQAQGRYEAAETTLLRALAIHERIHGPKHDDVIHVLHMLARLALERGDLAGAASYVERSVAAMGDGDEPMRDGTMLVQVRLALAQGRAASVVSLAEQAYQLREDQESPGPAVAEARFLWARALYEADPRTHERARALAEQAREQLEPYTDLQSMRQRSEVDAWLEALTRRDPPR